MSDTRKPWEIPIQYNEDRWVPPVGQDQNVINDEPDVRTAEEIEKLINRPARTEQRTYECTDTTPIDYGKGPHDDKYDIGDDRSFCDRVNRASDDEPSDLDASDFDNEFDAE